MTLPVVVTRTEVVEVDGQEIKVRGLLRSEAFQVKEVTQSKGELEGEMLIISFGTDTPVEEVQGWFAAAPNELVKEILDKIVRLSGLGEGARKSG